MKYILIDDCKTDLFTKEFDNKETAIETAKADFGRLTPADKKRRIGFYVLESVNPAEDAENHLDGTVIFDCLNAKSDTKKRLVIDCKYWVKNRGYTHTETIENTEIDTDTETAIKGAKEFCESFISGNSAKFKIMIYNIDSDPAFDEPETTETIKINM